MAAKPIKMEQLKQILRLQQLCYSKKKIVRETGLTHNTVKKYLANQYDDKPLDLKKDKFISISFNEYIRWTTVRESIRQCVVM